MCGFDTVFDTSVAADLTIVEEAAELVRKLENGENTYPNGNKYPLFTSCCPGWVSFMEKHFPELGENLSTAKSPQQMFGAIAKNYLAPKLGIDRRNFIVVSVMPCVAKKSEAARPEFGKDGDPDVNISITTRELAHMIRFANMNFDELEESDFDRPLGESTGAGVIFGTTGGVIEAAVRTAYEIQTKKTLPKLDFTELRGLAGRSTSTAYPSKSASHTGWVTPAGWSKRSAPADRPTTPSKSWPVPAAASTAAGNPITGATKSF